jgi:restriction system protein
VYFLGSIVSAYQWAPDTEAGSHVRKVKWTSQVPRDSLGVETRNTLGAIQTLFKLNPEAWRDIESHQAALGTKTGPSNSAVEAAASATRDEPSEAKELIREEVAQKADDFIEDAIGKLGPYTMQDLIAGILRAMGYITKVSPPGPDRGVDIFASPDGLGLQEPRIFVEVKHREGQMGAKEIRSFMGGRKQGDRCLYVSIGGFSKDAHYEAERSLIPLTLVNMADLRKLLVDHYDRLDAETRALVPLRKIYWPV